MAGNWAASGEIDTHGLYKASFGSFSDHYVYDDGMNKMFTVAENGDLVTKDEKFGKAINVGASSGAAGFAFTPIVWDKDVIDITRRLTPVQTLIPKVTNDGKVAEYYRVTARGSAAWGTEDPALEESDDTRQEASAAIKYLRVIGRVTGVAQVAGAHFESSMQREVLNKTQTINETIEEELLVGTNSATHGHDGIQQLLTANQNNLSGAEVSLSDVRELVDDCFMDKGMPNLLITDAYTASKLVEQQMDYVKYVDPVEFAWGLKTPSIMTVVGALPIVVSQFMPIGSDSKRIFCVNTNYLQQRVLQDITFERLAKTGDSEKFMLKTYRTLINKFPEGMGQIYGIA